MDKNHTQATSISMKRVTTQPVTCRERERLYDEIDYYKRAYKVAQERIDRIKRDRYFQHQRIMDTILMIIISLTSLVVVMFILSSSVHWAEYGW